MKLFVFLLIESLILCELQASIVSIESHEDADDTNSNLTSRKLGTTPITTVSSSNIPSFNGQNKKDEPSSNIFTDNEDIMASRNYSNSGTNVFLHKGKC